MTVTGRKNKDETERMPASALPAAPRFQTWPPVQLWNRIQSWLEVPMLNSSWPRPLRLQAVLRQYVGVVGFVALLSVALQGAAATPGAPTASNGREPDPARSWAVVSGTARDIRFEPLTRADGIPLERTYQVLQDRRGFIWFTTLEGLVRYDGYQHVHYPGIPLIGSTATTNRRPGKLFEAKNGSLWVASDVMSRFDPNAGGFTTVLSPRAGPARPGTDRITAVHDGPNDTLWVGLSSYNQSEEISEPILYELNPASGVSVPHRMDSSITGGKSVTIRAIEQDKRGRFWLGTSIGIVSYDPATGSFRHFSHTHEGDHWPPNAFSGLVWDKAGYLWVRMPAGIERFDPETENFDRFVATRLWNMTADSSGRIWLWGGTAGLEVFDPSSPADTALKKVPYRIPGSPFQEFTIPMLGPDRAGNIWAFFIPDFTLHRYSSRTMTFGKQVAEPDSANSLRGGMVSGFAENKDGSVWVATNSGLSLFDPLKGGITNFGHGSNHPSGLPSGGVLSVYRDRSGTLWVATDSAFGRFDGGTGRFVKLPLSGWSIWAVQSTFEDTQGRLWIGDQMGAIRLVDRKTGAVLRQFEGHVAYEDREGNIWFGAPPGLRKLDRTGHLRSIGLLQPAPANPLLLPTVRSIYEGTDGILWLASTAGLFRFDPRSERTTRFTSSDGLWSENLACVLPDEAGNLWISSDRGISRFDPRVNQFYNYDERDGLQGSRFNPRACYRALDGRLYFGGNHGFNAFYPREVLALSPDAPVTITSFQIKDQAAPIMGIDAVRLDHGQNGFSFEFAALSAPSPWKMRYRFKLAGTQEPWVEVDSAHRTARYTDLPPGDYVFLAEASTDGRTWSSKGAAISVTIIPPWWKTLWARVLGMLLAATVVVVAYRLRVATLHHRQEQMAALVDRRTAELASARDQAEAASRAKSAFLANMSHELRTPLNAILGFSDLLNGDNLSGEQRGQVNIIRRSGEHLLALIDDVLDMAKIEAGKQELEITPCNLISLVHDVVDMMRVRAYAKGVRLLCLQPPDYPRCIHADAPKLRQILLNLLSNAVKFTNEGGVTLRLSATAIDMQRLQLRFEVEDTGIGISPEDQARILEPFVQGGHAAVHKGTGLGLTITQRFVEMMGGTIGIESSPGCGSRFTVEVLVKQAEESETAGTEAWQSLRFRLKPGQAECRVLIVDDNEENAAVLGQMLRQAGFRTSAAQNGTLGVEQFRQWRPHFIWMDLRMPEMDGVEAARRIRELDGGHEVKIAAMTAAAFKSERDRAIAAGMDDFVGKPYRWKEVFECMAQHLGLTYCHEDATVVEGTEGAGLALRAALAELPHDVRRDLTDAVVSLDHRRICVIIDRVSVLDGALAAALSRLAERFAYTAILNALENSEGEGGWERNARPDVSGLHCDGGRTWM